MPERAHMHGSHSAVFDEAITRAYQVPGPHKGASPVGIQVIDGPDRDLCHSAAGLELTVGSSQENDMVLRDPSVSPHHLWLHSRDGILIRDLGSRTGTFLGGMRIREAT